MDRPTAFHRSVKTLLSRRAQLRREIDQVEQTKEGNWQSAMLHRWEEIDEIDRQVGLAYYWHALNLPVFPTATNVQHADTDSPSDTQLGT